MIIPLFGTGQEGKSPTVTAQSRVNVYAEMSKDPEKGQMSLHGFPGLVLYRDVASYLYGAIGVSTYGPIRGMFVMPTNEQQIPTSDMRTQDVLAYVLDGYLIQEWPDNTIGYSNSIASPSVAFPVQRVDATATIYTASDPALYIADDVSRGYLMLSTWPSTTHTPPTVLQNVDADAGLFTHIAAIAGKIVGNAKQGLNFQYSLTQTGLSWDALDFQSAETVTDAIIRMYAHRGILIAFGQRSTEFFTPSGDPDIPFTPVRGAALDWGLAARWSLASAGGSLVFLARNAQGQHQVVRLEGYTAVVVSDQELDSKINALSNVKDASGLSYNIGGHVFYQINFTEANKSYVLDVTNGTWSQLTDENGDRHWGETAVNINGTTYISDYRNGNIYTMSATAYKNDTAFLPREVVSRHFFKDFDRVIVDELTVDIEVGVGDLTTTDPQIMLQISKDNGRSWGAELWKSMGKIGETRKRVVWRRLGMGRDWTFRLRVTDPVKFVIAAAAINAVPVQG